MDIVSVVERISALAEPTISISAHRCLRAVDRHNSCELCMQACPVGALTFQEELNLDESKCQGCAACIQACPVGIFHGEDGAAELFRSFQVMGKTETVEIACGNHPNPCLGPGTDGLVLQTRRCLATLAPSVLLGLCKMGVKKISLRLDACAACSLGKISVQIQQSVEAAGYLLQQGCSETTSIELITFADTGWNKRPVIDVKNPPMSRRSFFDMLSHNSMRLVGQIVNDPNLPNAYEKQPGRERLRLAKLLHMFPDIIAENKLPQIKKLFSLIDLNVSEACTACEVCASMCPTAALEFITHEHSQFSLNFRPVNCVACGICVAYCEPGAASLESERALLTGSDFLQAMQERVVKAGELQQCERCHADFARKPKDGPQENRNLCPLCEFRRAQPFGFALPRKTCLKIGA